MSGDINERVAELIKALGISQNAFADSLNTSSARISNIVRKRNKPDSDLLALILSKYPDVNARWLVTGEGNMWEEGSARNTTRKYEKIVPDKQVTSEDAEAYIKLEKKLKEVLEENEKLKIRNEAYLEALSRLGKKG